MNALLIETSEEDSNISIAKFIGDLIDGNLVRFNACFVPLLQQKSNSIT
jgi:hypothetical protein